MYNLSKKDFLSLLTKSPEEIGTFLALEKAALVLDNKGDRFVAVHAEPTKAKSVRLYARVDVTMHAGLQAALNDQLPTNTFPFWYDSQGKVLAPVRTLSLDEFLTSYVAEGEVRQLPVSSDNLAHYKSVEQLPLGLRQKMYDPAQHISSVEDQYLDVVKKDNHVSIYIYHNYNSKYIDIDLDKDPTLYDEFKESLMTELPRLLLGYNLTDDGRRLIHTPENSRIKISVSSKNIPVTKGHTAFRFVVDEDKAPKHISLSWK